MFRGRLQVGKCSMWLDFQLKLYDIIMYNSP